MHSTTGSCAVSGESLDGVGRGHRSGRYLACGCCLMTSKRKKVRRPVGDATMVQQGDERDARLKHQALFLQARGLMSPEMADLKRQLLLLERLTGKGARKLDPRVADRIHGELENATMEQLKATGLVE